MCNVGASVATAAVNLIFNHNHRTINGAYKTLNKSIRFVWYYDFSSFDCELYFQLNRVFFIISACIIDNTMDLHWRSETFTSSWLPFIFDDSQFISSSIITWFVYSVGLFILVPMLQYLLNIIFWRCLQLLSSLRWILLVHDFVITGIYISTYTHSIYEIWYYDKRFIVLEMWMELLQSQLWCTFFFVFANNDQKKMIAVCRRACIKNWISKCLFSWLDCYS